MSEELAKVYSPAEVEQKWYKLWEESGYFQPVAGTKGPGAGKTFTIVIPPPNVTGSLHMGHALNNSIQDLLIRFKRMQSYETLWVPGTDHAGIATQNVVERELKKEGKKKEDLGREKFVEKVWEWKKEYGGRITQQLRRLGASCDWSRERFTMDEGLSKAVKRHFVQLYNEGLIYRGKRIINWCPRCGTAISDVEVQYETTKGHLWHIKYPLSDGKGFIIVATTRPETMLGDTAVAVSPKDDRYKHMWGKTVVLPLVGRRIPIIKDDHVDPSFGTGAVKVTPAHDPNDYDLGMRHNLPFLNLLTPEAKITLSEFSAEEKAKLADLEGLDRFKARAKIVELLTELDLLVKIDDHENSVGHCYRCNTVVEPYLSDQWFVKVDPLAKEANKAVEEGRTKLWPERWEKLYMQWMTNPRDWCISRQLWWGHQIPAWYKGEELYVGEEPPQGDGWKQDPDVFDTWFSSALWPFSVLGWPDKTEDLNKYYPTDVLVTSYDIIFFWVARMIMAGLHFMKDVPFRAVYFNALVKDIHGKKMSKSWGNVIDPLEVIDKAGADALRFTFISLIAGQGQDVKLAEDKITEARNFANKVWNASRFVLMSLNGKQIGLELPGELSLPDKWIISRYNTTIFNVTHAINDFNFGEAAKFLYEFIWGDLCDWYIEISKDDLYSSDPNKKERVVKVLLYVLEGSLRLLHPIMPFITEEIWQRVKEQVGGQNMPQSIMLAEWPQENNSLRDEKLELKMEQTFQDITTKIRAIKAARSIQTKDVEVTICVDDKAEYEFTTKTQEYIKALTKTKKLEIFDSLKERPKLVATFESGSTKGWVSLEGVIDPAQEIEKMNKEVARLEQERERLGKLLADESFVAKAPKTAIEAQKNKLVELAEKKQLLLEQIKDLS